MATGLGLAGQPINEGHVGEHAVLILRLAQLGEQLLHILLGDLVPKVAEDVVELGEHHGAVTVLVIEFEQLEVVGIDSLAVGGLDGLLALFQDLVKLAELLALLVGLAKADADLLGGVEAHGVHDVSEEEHVKLALAVPVVDVADLHALISVNHLVTVVWLLWWRWELD